MSKRELVARVLDGTGMWRLILRARSRLRAPVLTALSYRRIQEPDRIGPFDPGVVDATPARFEAQVELFARHFNLIGLAELERWLAGGELPPNPGLLTFDDGYRECVDVVLPILARHRAPAVFFIATRYVDERRVYWWDKIRLIVDRSRRPRIELTRPRPLSIDLGDRDSAAADLCGLVRGSYGLDLDRFLEEVAESAGVDIDAGAERALADRLVMTWDDVRALRDAGMDVQSHTHDHRVLQTLSAEQQLDELGRSREILEGELGDPVRAVAYPGGRSVRHDPQLRLAVSRAGYRAGFSNGTGVNYLWRDLDPLDLQRLSFDAGTPPSLIRGVLAVPPLARVGR